ncbi:MAG: sulfite exporter TauE/SafE family protein [Deltaproteobacteria bacterium]|nr:sulfite exporter TauE/SafE family protein [Deltaproteobacteria bacterium]
MHTAMVVLGIFVLTVVMIMSGRGGGSFYVITLVLSGVPVHTASTTSQFILLASALAGAFIYGKAKTMSWPLVAFFGGLNSLLAFVGGFQAHLYSGSSLKMVLSIALAIAGVTMLFSEKKVIKTAVGRLGYWNIHEGENTYVVNLWLATPMTMVTGFLSGMVGISGGAFLVPLMVVGCGVPTRTAIGTATAMLAATAFTGFAGNALHGGFDPVLAIPCGIVAILGGVIGGRLAMKTKSKKLKTLSGFITIIAAIIMMVSAVGGE